MATVRTTRARASSTGTDVPVDGDGKRMGLDGGNRQYPRVGQIRPTPVDLLS
jgi:hypothetical protein